MADAERVQSGRNVLTRHAPERYPGLLVLRPAESWGDVSVIVPSDGQTIEALGGERVYAYETVEGARAEGFELQPRDRATLVRSDLPCSLVEWRIERA